MNAFIALLLAGIPNALLAIAAKLLTQAFFQTILEKVIVAGLERASDMTTNTVDDALVEEVKRRLSMPTVDSYE